MTTLPRQEVTLDDGTVVTFPARQQTVRTFEVEDTQIRLHVAFRDGTVQDLILLTDSPLISKLAAIGALHRTAQAMAGLDNEDAVAACAATFDALADGKMPGEADPASSYKGAGIVVQAVAEAKGITVLEARDLIEATLARAEAAGKPTTRQALYAAFRTPGSKTAPIIARLEAERDAARADSARGAEAATEVDNLLDDMEVSA